jgi:hypothetical protein
LLQPKNHKKKTQHSSRQELPPLIVSETPAGSQQKKTQSWVHLNMLSESGDFTAFWQQSNKEHQN